MVVMKLPPTVHTHHTDYARSVLWVEYELDHPEWIDLVPQIIMAATLVLIAICCGLIVNLVLRASIAWETDSGEQSVGTLLLQRYIFKIGVWLYRT